jgi:cell division protein FtsI (penicillin-binding protein 3)
MPRERSKRKVREPVVPNYRLRRQSLLAVLACGLILLLWRAVDRQILETDFLQDQGERRYLRVLEIPAYRGEISDRHGEPLALTAPVVTVWADGRYLPADAEEIPSLAKALSMPLKDLRELLRNNRERAFLYLKRGVRPEVGAQAMAVMRAYEKQHKVRAIGLEREYRRYYPSGEISANIDDRGQEGLELSYEDWLTGHPGARRVIQDGRGRVVEEVESIRLPEAGKALALSVDRRLQFLAYRELKRAVQANNAEGGAAVIIDVASGEILAMVNQPSYNPNDRASIRPGLLRNRAVTDVFEPGSTMKPFAVAAVLQAGKATPRTPVDTKPGYLRVGRQLVRDHHNYGLLDVTSVLTKSSNVGVSKLALELEPEYLWRSYERLGIGRLTASGFPGEVPGVLPYFDGWSRFEQATHSFGYGLSVTVLQLAQAYAVLAADGVYRQPSLLRRQQIPPGTRVMRRQVAQAVRQMLETVVSNQGTAKRAAVAGYRVAGKTGTVKKSVAGGYSSDRYQAVFAGMIPATEPRLVMAVMVDEPAKKDYYGGLVAAPIFAKVMEDAMRLLNVPPDVVAPADQRLAQAGTTR